MKFPKKIENFTNIQKEIYNIWLKNNCFFSKKNKKKSYTIIMPPPNVTGDLHIGHILNNSIQDVLIRRNRMKGYNVCWVPGTDHASIATEILMIKKLNKLGLKKEDIGRKKFLIFVKKNVINNKKKIINQLKSIGCSCDWSKIKFSMDSDMNKNVIKFFLKLYEKGLIYRSYDIINWDVVAKTTISDEEIYYKEINGKLYYIKYKTEKNNFIFVATTRPETIFGDSAIGINPNDKRYYHLHNDRAIIPIINKSIPIILDSSIDINFGTGCMKITPAHDYKDKIIGKKHNLDFINILNLDGTLNENAGKYKGLYIIKSREKIVLELYKKKSILKIENYKYSVGFSSRTNSIVEPILSLQWFIKMKKISISAFKYVVNGKIKFYPKKIENTYFNWLKNIKDWNISRQLWWGHQIPVYYYTFYKNKKLITKFVVAENYKKAINKIKKKNIKPEKIVQDYDVLDTWFSSCIWPISVFDGIKNKNNNDFRYYYPTKDLVTGPDILFFWVTRMIIFGLLFTNKKPFYNVYFTGIVRDKYRKKMSKSLGNYPNTEKLIKKYGSDSIRFFVLFNSIKGKDFIFDEKKCIQGRNFINKIWNSFLLIKSFKKKKYYKINKYEKISFFWIKNKFYQLLQCIEEDFLKFRISDSLLKIYNFFWKNFCSYYLEIIKTKDKIISYYSFDNNIKLFKKILQIIHPYLPFVTEKIWQLLHDNNEKKLLILSNYPKKKKLI
ncbi:valine--tRNA ligase [Candidatus Shikimatogenerans silvanidophilus]|uniref:valine--tRNA ligase n=1 Tax=Candidatus Shikimatogenerans silvanidophilus TaxID=2782547 RepID=UPI001F524653|nr:valine--tRNA ligase [Candidatus Shikimatogenerans silvanidophilus]